MFSVQFGDSIAHVIRTREIANYLNDNGHEIVYLVSSRGFPFLKGYLNATSIIDNNQSYGFSRLEAFATLEKKFCDRVKKEHSVFKEFRPDLVIGAFGLSASAFCPRNRLIKIINRFFLDIGNNEYSSFSISQRNILTQQFESLVNAGRRTINIRDEFRYEDFLNGFVLVSGAKPFVAFSPANAINIGFTVGMSFPENFVPDKKTVFVLSGTGQGLNKADVVNKIIYILKDRFNKIYISTGANCHINSNKWPSNIIAKPFFKSVPDDVGTIICNGGNGAIHLGLALGLWIIVLPFQIEQYSNGKRLEEMGCGRNYGKVPNNNFKGFIQEVDIDWHKFNDEVGNINYNCKMIDMNKQAGGESIFSAIREYIPNLY